MDDVVIELRNVDKSYSLESHPWRRLWQQLSGRGAGGREFHALRHVNLCIRRGEVVGVVGRNGAGKSTLFQLLLGSLQPERGEVLVPGGWRVSHMAQQVEATERPALEFVIDGHTALRRLEREADPFALDTRLQHPAPRHQGLRPAGERHRQPSGERGWAGGRRYSRHAPAGQTGHLQPPQRPAHPRRSTHPAHRTGGSAR